MKIRQILWSYEDMRLRFGMRLVLQLLLSLAVIGLFETLLAFFPLTPDWIAPGSNVMLLAGVSVSLWLGSKFIDRRRFADYGFHLSWRWDIDFIFGLLLGAFLMGMIFLIEYCAGWVTVEGFVSGPEQWQMILFGLITFICVGFFEEMISRGYLIKNLSEAFQRLGKQKAILAALVVTSIVFGLLHLGNPNSSWVSTINLVAAGLLLALGFLLTGNLAISIGLHITWNFFQGLVFGFPVSGVDSGGSVIIISQLGPDWATGGSFGPEAGLVGLVAIAVGCGLIWLYVRWTRGKAGLHLPLAVYTAERIPSYRFRQGKKPFSENLEEKP